MSIIEVNHDKLYAMARNASPPIVDGMVEHHHLYDEWNITTPQRMAHFMAQVAAETGGFARLTENLNYSAQRLCQVWPKRFPNINAAIPFANNPEALAEKVYGGRMGNVEEGWGYLYRGRGPKQLTGYDSYRGAEEATGIPFTSDPDLAACFPEGLVAACWYWNERNVLEAADNDDLETVTRRINGGLIGLNDRRHYLTLAKRQWR